MIATIIIPVSPAHWANGVYREAQASAEAQTIATPVLVIRDTDGRGASWARNRGVEQCKTLFVVFLDADDTLEPHFVQRTANRWKPGYYVYTDYTINGHEVQTPPELDIWKHGQQHITPTLIPRVAWRAVGGFDETLDTLEDEDFFYRLHAYGWCGIKQPGALAHYRRTRGLSLVNRDAHDLDVVERRIAEKNALFQRRYQTFMGCGCRENRTIKEGTPTGERGPNDVLAKALYSPATKHGPISGRKYARTGLGRPLWVDPDDAAARPEWWAVIAPNPENVSPDPARVRELAAQTKRPEPHTVEPDLPPTPMPAHLLAQYPQTQGPPLR